MSSPYLKVTSDFTKTFNETIARFKKDAVLVGIPQDESAREPEDDESDSPMNNAGLLALNHFGSEEANIPPRPVLSIGIAKAQDAIAEQFKVCAQTVLSKGPAALETYYERAGIIASNACKKVINDQEGIAPPAESTIKGRKYATKAGFKGTKALLVTAQMRNAITYVVNKWGR